MPINAYIHFADFMFKIEKNMLYTIPHSDKHLYVDSTLTFMVMYIFVLCKLLTDFRADFPNLEFIPINAHVRFA